jgi:hypothetical protein
MKIKIITALFSVCIALSGIAGFASFVQANSNEYSFSFYNTQASDHTTPQTKSSSKKVYVHAKSGPALKYTVEGATATGYWHTRSSQITINSGHTANITNSVHSNGETRARLQLVRTTSGYVYSKGSWIPDPS